jgi:hypothetical protein
MELGAIGWLTLSMFAGLVASSKGRCGVAFFSLSMLLSRVLGILAAVAARRATNAYRKCHVCAEFVRGDAVKCRYCWSDLGPYESAAFRVGRAFAALTQRL